MAAKTRILFVDDEPLVLQGFQRLLRNMRSVWDMVFVDSAFKGLEALAEAPFDVVVADMRMPGMDGAEFLNRVMREHPTTIRIVLSGQADSDLLLKVEGAAHQFLSKPCDPEILRSVILAATDIGGRIRSDEVRKVLGGIAHLPVIPAVYQELVVMVEAEATTVEDLGRVVQRDPGMTANILKLVNSAYFGLRQRVSDPSEAVSFLGVETLKSLALVHGIFQQVAGFPTWFNGGHLWRHSLETATVARDIARSEGLGPAVEADCFTGGLLHDVGLLILASGLREDYRQVYETLRADPGDVPEAELRILGVHHGEVGAHVLGLWGLPVSVVESVARHHHPPADAGLCPALVVYAAEFLSSVQGDRKVFGLSREEEVTIPPVLAPWAGRWGRIMEKVQDAGGPS